MGCSQELTSKSSTNQTANSNGPTVFVDAPVSGRELLVGLRRAKGLVLNNTYMTQEERNFARNTDEDATAEELSKYTSLVQGFINQPEAPEAIHKFYSALFNIAVADPILAPTANEPANLAAHLFKENSDFRDFVKAQYCVTDLADGLQRDDCIHTGRVNPAQANPTFNMSVPMEMRAGFISTQAFLSSYAGALNFRRTSKAFLFALCTEGPNYGETSGWSESPNQQVPNVTMHPFYWSSINQNPTMNCTSCHGAGDLIMAEHFFQALET